MVTKLIENGLLDIMNNITQNCYNCKHRQDVPGSAHSSCGSIPEDNKFLIAVKIEMLSNLGMQSNFITLNPHGVRNGWCTWPIDFDPCWVSDCKLWEGMDVVL